MNCTPACGWHNAQKSGQEEVTKVNTGPRYCCTEHFIYPLIPWKQGRSEGAVRGDSHTFDLIKLFTYPHMPPGPIAGHMKDGAWAKRRAGERERQRGRKREREYSSDLAPGERKFNDMQGGKAQVTSRD